MQYQKIPRAQLLAGWISALLISLGTLFKLMHWPGASAMLTLGIVTFCLFYLPLWLLNAPKKGQKIILGFQFIVLLMCGAAFLFKTQHWPGAGVLFNLWIGLSLYILLPVSLVLLFASGNKTTTWFHQAVVYFLLGSMIIGGVGGSAQRGDNIARSFTKNTRQVSNSIARLDIRNDQLYAAFEHLPDKESNLSYKRAVLLQKITDSASTYLQQFRRHLIALAEDIPEREADTVADSEIRSISNSAVVLRIICGEDDYKPLTGKYSGSELKSVIEKFRDSIPGFLEGESRNFIKNSMNLDTEPAVDENGETEDWVFVTFRGANMAAALLTLENLKYEVKNAETQVLTDLLNATKINSDNLAVKVAELGSKLETEKKQREIEQLKNERELAQLSLTNKNIEIDAQNQVIIFFVLGLLLCCVLIFFIIRSNIIRKKINLELKHQKHLIEEKNKEITDSIRYAQRIQKAHLPTGSYIEKNITRMTKED
jgi:hypothetical protein